MTHEFSFGDAMFESHRYLCRRGARRFFRRGLERTDLEQVAAIGLIKACRRYDAAKETPFEAFAWIMILGELMHHVRDFEHLVRMPRWVRGMERRYVDVVERLTARLERDPSECEISADLGVQTHVVRELRRAQASRTPDGMDAARGRSSFEHDPLEGLLARRALEAVEPAARSVVLGIYALGLSRNEVARRSGMTVRQVARTHDAALDLMRRTLRT